MPESRSVTALAKVETLRLAKHPVFVVGFLLWAFALVTSLDTSYDYYNIAIVPAFFIGVFSMVAMFRLTRSTERAEEALTSAPSTVQDRVLALCLATVLPAVLGVVSYVAILLFEHVDDPSAYGAWDRADRAAIFLGEVVLACIGGPLLGVAAGRWLRFPGASAALVVGIFVWVMAGEGTTGAASQPGWLHAIRMSAPWAQYTGVDSQKHELDSWRGSPWWHLGWLVALCVLAVLGALLKGAEPARRERLLRAGLVVGLVGLVLLVLAVVLGPEHALRYTPTGVSSL